MTEEESQSEHFKTIQRNKKISEQPETQPEQPQQPEQPGLPGGMSVSSILELLQNPVVRSTILSNPQPIRELIQGYESLVYPLLQSSYPDIYEALSTVEPEEEKDNDKGTELNETINKPVPREAINYEIISMHSEGYSPTEIADYLSEKYDIELFPMQVGRTIKRLQAATAQKKPSVPTPSSIVTPRINIPSTAAMPAPLKIPDVEGMYFNIISTVRWGAVVVLSGILGFILGKVV